jgi:hypothetical protein
LIIGNIHYVGDCKGLKSQGIPHWSIVLSCLSNRLLQFPPRGGGAVVHNQLRSQRQQRLFAGVEYGDGKFFLFKR